MKFNTIKRYIEHIPVFEITPEASSTEALPLVVYYHGWKTSKELAMTPARKIAQHNIRVVIPDAMNHGERRIKQHSSIPSITFWSSIQHNLSEFDLIKNFYSDRGLIKDNNIGVGGFSMGGMTTAGLLTHHPEIRVGAILMGTPNYQGFVDRVVYHAGQMDRHIPTGFRDLLSWTNTFDLNQQPEKLAGRPVYFWHGTEDAKIPYDSSHNFYLEHINTPYGRGMTYETSEGEPHLLTIDIMEKTGVFFNDFFN